MLYNSYITQYNNLHKDEVRRGVYNYIPYLLVFLIIFLILSIPFAYFIFGFGGLAIQTFISTYEANGIISSLIGVVIIFGFAIGFLWVYHGMIRYLFGACVQMLHKRRKDLLSKEYLRDTILPRFFSPAFTDLKGIKDDLAIPLNQFGSNLTIYGNVMLVEYDIKNKSKNKTAFYGIQDRITNIEDAFGFTFDRRRHVFNEMVTDKVSIFAKNHLFTTIYKWASITSDVDHSFSGNTVVYTKNLKDFKVYGLDEDETESVEFNKIFNFYTSDGVEARVCLKTNVMSALLDLSQKVDYMWVEFAYNKVFIAVSNKKGLFDVGPEELLTGKRLQHDGEMLMQLVNLSKELNINHNFIYR